MISYVWLPVFGLLIFIMIIDTIIWENYSINESNLEFQFYAKNNLVSYSGFNHDLKSYGINKIYIQSNANKIRYLDSNDLILAANNSNGSNQNTTANETSYSSIIAILVVWGVIGLWGILLLVVFIIPYSTLSSPLLNDRHLPKFVRGTRQRWFFIFF